MFLCLNIPTVVFLDLCFKECLLLMFFMDVDLLNVFNLREILSLVNTLFRLSQ